MKKQSLPIEDVQDYVMGTLPTLFRGVVDEARAVMPDLDAYVTEVELGLIPMFVSGPSVKPPADIWALVEGHIEGEHVSHVDMTIDLKSEGIWAVTGVGVRTKMLWDGRSMLIECQAGAVIPDHMHWAEERILVISGDVCFGGRIYAQGDTISMRKDTLHGDTTTQTGCLFLLSYVN